jgi:hypothetical protein
MGVSALVVFDDLDVEALAVIANEAAEEVESSARKTVEHAERCGRALLAAKEKVPHGQWLGWLAKSFDYSQVTASQYMRIANYKHASNLHSATSIRDALRLIADDPETPTRERKSSVEVVQPSRPATQSREKSEPTGEQVTLAVNSEETRKAPIHRAPEKFAEVTPSYEDEDEEEQESELPYFPPPEEPQRDMLDMFEDMKQLIRDAMHEFPSGHRQLIWKQLFEQLNEEDIEQW